VSRIRAGYYFGIGCVLLAAAFLKGYQLTFHGIRLSGFLPSIPLHIVFIVIECAFGAWLLTGLYQSLTRVAAIVFFAGLLETALWLAIQGETSCGCLGNVEMNPWYAVCFDAFAIACFMWSRPDPEVWTVFTHKHIFHAYVVFLVAIGLPGILMVSGYRREVKKQEYPLRLDDVLNNTIVKVHLGHPTSGDVLKAVAKQTGFVLTVDDSLRRDFDAVTPDPVVVNENGRCAWAVLESMARRMPGSLRWVRIRGGWELIADEPLRRTQFAWVTGLGFGAIALGWIAWDARKHRAVA